MTSGLETSRFVVCGDPRADRFIFDIPPAWWSRSYEYEWASRFARTNDVALDAASGVCHPLKFYLADHCREVHACDLDPRIDSPGAIREEVAEVFGADAAANLPSKYLDGVCYAKAALHAMPYADATFDRVYCISVIEHLDDGFNRYPLCGRLRPLLRHIPGWKQDVRRTLKEFKRVLKPGGQVVLTFDYPRINLAYFGDVVREVGLRYAGPVEDRLPADAIHEPRKKLYCYRAVLAR